MYQINQYGILVRIVAFWSAVFFALVIKFPTGIPLWMCLAPASLCIALLFLDLKRGAETKPFCCYDAGRTPTPFPKYGINLCERCFRCGRATTQLKIDLGIYLSLAILCGIVGIRIHLLIALMACFLILGGLLLLIRHYLGGWPDKAILKTILTPLPFEGLYPARVRLEERGMVAKMCEHCGLLQYVKSSQCRQCGARLLGYDRLDRAEKGQNGAVICKDCGTETFQISCWRCAMLLTRPY